MFSRSVNQRLDALPALLAALAMVLWPALASANCCCHKDRSIPSAASIAVETAQSACPACCAKDGKDVAKDKDAKNKDTNHKDTNHKDTAHRDANSSPAGTPSCCASSDAGDCGDSDDCQCEFRCCQYTHATLSAPVVDDASQLIVAVDAPFERLLPSPSRTVSSEAIGYLSSIGSAQDQCALLCRWLK
tara:strand:+ start:208801 stop:209367 length:567 start_codon:yes stop_codon:yes gene_type:complete